MSGLFSSLNASMRAIAAHSRAIETTGKNLANVDNTTYARQRVVYGDRLALTGTDGLVQGSGLEAIAVQQLRNELVDRQVVRETSLKALYEAQQDLLGRAETALGQNITRSQTTAGTSAASSVGGLAAAVDDFFNAFQELAARPTDSGARQTLLQQAATLVERLRTTNGRIDQLESDANAQVGDDVATANRLLSSIAVLNARIAAAEVSSPGSAVDLRDERQARVEELSRQLAVELHSGTNGQINVVARDASNAEVLLVDGSNVTGPLAFDGTAVTGGAAATPLVLTAGSIRGVLDVRVGALQPLRTELDALAQQMVTAVNAAYNPGSTGPSFFSDTGVTAASIALSPALTAANLRAGTGAAGDNSIALAVAQLSGRSFAVAEGDAIDGTFAEHYARSIAALAGKVATAKSNASDQTAIEQYVRSQRDAVSGVSLDEEMADLVKYQRAFQASSRVFSIVDQLLESVVNQLGR
jgi:flagellar hook-associated protein 1 FlgK